VSAGGVANGSGPGVLSAGEAFGAGAGGVAESGAGAAGSGSIGTGPGVASGVVIGGVTGVAQEQVLQVLAQSVLGLA